MRVGQLGESWSLPEPRLREQQANKGTCRHHTITLQHTFQCCKARQEITSLPLTSEVDTTASVVSKSIFWWRCFELPTTKKYMYIHLTMVLQLSCVFTIYCSW
jgi:hypothetical protein